jgi:AraC-like DNA-binding protein
VERWTEVLSDVNLVGAVHALGQAVLLWCVRRGARRGNRIMAVFLVLLAFGMSHGVASRIDAYERWPWLALLMATLPLLYGPLFFFYVRALTTPGLPWRRQDALHGVPFLLGLAVYLVPGTPWSGDARLVHAIPVERWHAVLLLATAQTVAYLRGIRAMLRRHEATVRDSCSTSDKVTLGWLRWRVRVYGIIWAAGILGLAVFAFAPATVALVSQMTFALVAANTFLAGYRAMLQPVFFITENAERQAGRYERSSLTPEDAARHEARLLALMARERPFLDPDLTLPALARALGVHPAHLSRVINERLGRNFFEFVNRYRVEAACQRLRRPEGEKEKLITIAIGSGFNSLATFNRVFKELTGRTPSAYRRHPDPERAEDATSA